MYETRQQNCIFCARHGQPASLFETLHFSVMPGKFTLLPRHVLIITNEHRRCHAEASIEEIRALTAVVCRVRRFLDVSYALPVCISESGEPARRSSLPTCTWCLSLSGTYPP